MKKTTISILAVMLLFGAVRPVLAAQAAGTDLQWVSPDHYRLLLTVDAKGTRRNSPASVDIDLQAALAGMGAKGTVDLDTIEVIGYDQTGKPRTFDVARKGYEQYLLPARVERYFPISRVTLSFVMPDEKCAQYAVYFDTVESKMGKPKRYQGFGRRRRLVPRRLQEAGDRLQPLRHFRGLRWRWRP